MKQKLLHIMMGNHNPDLRKGLDSVFECFHFNWTTYGVISHKLQLDVINKFIEFKPDIVFMHIQSGDAINIETIKVIAKSSIVINWTGDVRHPLQKFYIDFGKHIHSTLFTNMNDVETCKSNGISSNYLQVGFDSTHFNPLGTIDNKYPEIIFLGSHYSNHPFPLTQLRYDMVIRLKNEFGSRFGLYGGGWNGLENGNISSYEEEGKAYRSCKIAINLSHFAYKRYSSDRMYRIMGGGAFCLTHNFPDIELDFKVGKELVVWDDLDDLVYKIRKYLTKDNERGLIALNGCLKARTEFTWHHFAKNLKTIVDDIKIKKYE